MTPRPELSDADFEAIRAVVAATPRGRLFLAEYNRRRRAEDAAALLAAVGRPAAASDRAADLMRALADLLRGPPARGGLERRFAALIELDRNDPDSGFIPFG